MTERLLTHQVAHDGWAFRLVDGGREVEEVAPHRRPRRRHRRGPAVGRHVDGHRPVPLVGTRARHLLEQRRYVHPAARSASRASSLRSPSTRVSGRGGHPGMYRSTGTIVLTPLVTEYESQYGPPELAHEPNEITCRGSGICS